MGTRDFELGFEMAEARTERAEDRRAGREAQVATEIDEAMQRALCRGENVKVASWKPGKGMYGDDIETAKDAADVLWDHLGDEEAQPLLKALLRTNCQEAQALVAYAAGRHAWFNASDINNLRDRDAEEPSPVDNPACWVRGGEGYSA